jgi:hypothetical protein
MVYPNSFDSDSSEDERVARRNAIEHAEVRTAFNLDLERADVLEAVATLLRAYEGEDYYAYERYGTWHVGLSR